MPCECVECVPDVLRDRDVMLSRADALERHYLDLERKLGEVRDERNRLRAALTPSLLEESRDA